MHIKRHTEALLLQSNKDRRKGSPLQSGTLLKRVDVKTNAEQHKDSAQIMN